MEEPTPQKISLWAITKKWLWLSYDHIGWLILLNFLIAIGSVAIVTAGFCFSLAFIWTYRLLSENSFSFREGWEELRKNWKWALGYGSLLFVIFLVFLVNLYFYRSFHQAGRLAQWLAIFVFWITLIYLMFALWVLPTKIYFQESLKNSFKKAWVLCFDNLKVSFAMFFVFGFWLVLGLLTGVFYFLASLTLPAAFVWVAFGEVMKKYGRQDPLPDVESRTLRELVRPWAS